MGLGWPGQIHKAGVIGGIHLKKDERTISASPKIKRRYQCLSVPGLNHFSITL